MSSVHVKWPGTATRNRYGLSDGVSPLTEIRPVLSRATSRTVPSGAVRVASMPSAVWSRTLSYAPSRVSRAWTAGRATKVEVGLSIRTAP